MTDCHEVQKFVQAFLDGEFDDQERAALMAHLQSCESCSRLTRFEERFKHALQQHAGAEPAAPSHLKVRVRQALDRLDHTTSWSGRWLWRLIPAGVAALLLVGVALSRREELSPLTDLAEESLAWHRQNLPLDVTGSSPEKVQRFFADKVPFAVRPPLLASPQAQLVGARLTNLGARQAAYLIYQVGPERVSVFIFDPQGVLEERGQTEVQGGEPRVHWQGLRGYHVGVYLSGGTGYVVTSNLNPGHLVRLISHTP